MAQRQLDALLLRPGLPHPSRRRRLPGHDREPTGRAALLRRLQRDRGGAIAALVIDQNDRERAGIGLAEQGADAFRDAFGFIARWDDRNHRGPRCLQ